jgi:hypothetical protein
MPVRTPSYTNAKKSKKERHNSNERKKEEGDEDFSVS